MTIDPVNEQSAVYQQGRVELASRVDWPEGTRLLVRPVELQTTPTPDACGLVIIAGFGLAGRSVADLLEQGQIDYVVVEKNAVTVETQGCLGRRVVHGDIAEESTLQAAGIESASILALTIPDEAAVLAATSVARRMRPNIYIIARTTYTSAGLKASQLGADEVIKAEQAVALQFYERLHRRLTGR